MAAAVGFVPARLPTRISRNPPDSDCCDSDEADDVLRIGHRAIDQLQAQQREKRVIRAAGHSSGTFGEPAIGTPQGLQPCGERRLPVVIGLGQQIDAGRRVQRAPLRIRAT